MDRNLQIWFIVITFGPIATMFMHIFLVSILIRLQAALRPRPGQRSLLEIADRAGAALEGADRAIRTTVDILEEIKPVVHQTASVSRRELPHADRVFGDAPTGVARIQSDVSYLRSCPMREARAWSAGVMTAMIAFFPSNGTAGKGKRW